MKEIESEIERNVPESWHLSNKTYELFRNEKWVRKIDEFVKHSSPEEETADELVERIGVVMTVPYKKKKTI